MSPLIVTFGCIAATTRAIVARAVAAAVVAMITVTAGCEDDS